MSFKTLKIITILFFTLTITSLAKAEYDCEGKTFKDKNGNRHYLHKPTARIKNIIDRILTVAEIYDADDYVICMIKSGYNNASISPQGRYIVYDQRFLYSLARTAGEMHWGVVAIMAHEIGHHVFEATGGESSFISVERTVSKELATLAEARKGELKADAFAGYALAKLGASLENSQAMMKVLGSRWDDIWSSHPSSPKRVNATTIGWLQACKELGNECNHAAMKNKNQASKVNSAIGHRGVTETTNYSRLIASADKLKGKRVNRDYCKLYANVAILQAKRNQQYQCGHSVDPKDIATQWSLQWKPQYDWCMKMSSYATQKEANYREMKLVECLQ